MNDKELVAHHAASLIKDGMIVGLGTGSTANCFIQALARRKNKEGLQITAASSSLASAKEAEQVGLSLIAIEKLTQLDVYVDGADEVDPDNILLKGQGADLVKEKILATICGQFIVLVEPSKLVNKIGDRFAIPVEVIPFAWQLVKEQLNLLGGKAKLRLHDNGNKKVISSHGSYILDVTFGNELSSSSLNLALDAMPGVVEHGIFNGLASMVLCAIDGRVQVRD